MKIIKLPFKTKLECTCGCDFEFDYDDIDTEEFQTYGLQGIWHTKQLSIYCPLCHCKHVIKEDLTIESSKNI